MFEWFGLGTRSLQFAGRLGEWAIHSAPLYFDIGSRYCGRETAISFRDPGVTH